MRIATWNVASLTPERLERLHEWLGYAEPDVVCLQETKKADDDFPALDLLAHGYETAHHGQGRWNGVAILSRVGLDDIQAGFGDGGPDDPEARLVSATCNDVRVSSVYVPNGREVDHEQYHYKLDWLARLRGHLEATAKAGSDVAVCGDFNIAPTDLDVWDVAKFEGATHVSEPERRALAELQNWGLRDVFREQHPDVGELFTWWDYRGGAFHKGHGMRIDLILASDSLADRASWALMDRNMRKGNKPSDHAPVLVEFD